jgi:hypothetical protein
MRLLSSPVDYNIQSKKLWDCFVTAFYPYGQHINTLALGKDKWHDTTRHDIGGSFESPRGHQMSWWRRDLSSMSCLVSLCLSFGGSWRHVATQTCAAKPAIDCLIPPCNWSSVAVSITDTNISAKNHPSPCPSSDYLMKMIASLTDLVTQDQQLLSAPSSPSYLWYRSESKYVCWSLFFSSQFFGFWVLRQFPITKNLKIVLYFLLCVLWIVLWITEQSTSFVLT